MSGGKSSHGSMGCRGVQGASRALTGHGCCWLWVQQSPNWQQRWPGPAASPVLPAWLQAAHIVPCCGSVLRVLPLSHPAPGDKGTVGKNLLGKAGGEGSAWESSGSQEALTQGSPRKLLDRASAATHPARPPHPACPPLLHVTGCQKPFLGSRSDPELYHMVQGKKAICAASGHPAHEGLCQQDGEVMVTSRC